MNRRQFLKAAVAVPITVAAGAGVIATQTQELFEGYKYRVNHLGTDTFTMTNCILDFRKSGALNVDWGKVHVCDIEIMA